jgi:hypothetical protein
LGNHELANFTQEQSAAWRLLCVLVPLLVLLLLLLTAVEMRENGLGFHPPIAHWAWHKTVVWLIVPVVTVFNFHHVGRSTGLLPAILTPCDSPLARAFRLLAPIETRFSGLALRGSSRTCSRLLLIGDKYLSELQRRRPRLFECPHHLLHNAIAPELARLITAAAGGAFPVDGQGASDAE